MLFIRLSEMGERMIHRHQTTLLEPLDQRKILVSPTGRATCSLWAGPNHNPRRPAGSSHAVVIWLVRQEERHRPRAGRTQGTDGNVVGTIIGRDFGTEVEDSFFFVPLFSNVETTQCEEEDRSRQDTETDRQMSILSSTSSEREVEKHWLIEGHVQAVLSEDAGEGEGFPNI